MCESKKIKTSATGQTIYYNTQPGKIGSTTPTSGGDESITYSWRLSVDGYNDATYTPLVLTSTTSYRRYAKDGTCIADPEQSTGKWTVTVHHAATITDLEAEICVNSSYIVPGGTASATNYSAVLWAHDGAGSLTNEATLEPTYTPHADDAGNNVILTMEVTGDGECGTVTLTASNQVTITMVDLPDALLDLTASDITTNTFTANWTEVPGTVTYTLEVALDVDFNGSADSIGNIGTTSHTMIGLVSNTTCYYRVSATYDCGTSEYSSTVSVTTATPPFKCGNPFTDPRDGQTYNTVLINEQCWMKENLMYLPKVEGPGTGSITEADYYVFEKLISRLSV